MKKTRVCVDFDGVLTDYDGNWEEVAPPLEGAVEFLRKLVTEGFIVDILTARKVSEVYDWVQQYVPELYTCWDSDENAFTLTATNMKRPAVAYIDDRAIRFNGDFEDAYDQLFTACWWMSKPGAYEGWTPDGVKEKETVNG